jgi:hypothetical protein
MTGALNEISIYQGELTKFALVEQTKRVLNMFPKFPQPMLEELKNAFADNGFTDERMKDAVNHVRDTYEGWDKLPNIANFIQYDKKIKIYDENDILKMYPDNYIQSTFQGKSIVMVKGSNPAKLYYEKIDLSDRGIDTPRWVKKEDFAKNKLKLWGNK